MVGQFSEGANPLSGSLMVTSPVSSCGERNLRAPWGLFYKNINPPGEGSILMSPASPKGPTC